MTPEHIKQKIEAAFPIMSKDRFIYEENFNQHRTRQLDDIKTAEFGYSLAQQEIKERDEEIKRLKERLSFHTEDTWYDEKYVNELIRTAGNAQDTLIKEIERLSKENTELKAKLNG